MYDLSVLKEQLRVLQGKTFGKFSEKPKEPEDKNGKSALTSVSGYTRLIERKNSRRKTTDLSHLPHFRIEHDLPDNEKICTCCSQSLILIGKDYSKKPKVLPKRLYVAEHLSYKHACRSCQTLVEAKKKKTAIPKGLGGDSLIVEILENKYSHLPLYRQSLMLEEEIWCKYFGHYAWKLGKSCWRKLAASLSCFMEVPYWLQIIFSMAQFILKHRS